MKDVKKFLRNPIEIEAMQFIGGSNNGDTIIRWVGANGGVASYIPEIAAYNEEREVRVNNRPKIAIKQIPRVPDSLTVGNGDDEIEITLHYWIINDPDRGFVQIKPDVFSNLYSEIIPLVEKEVDMDELINKLSMSLEK